MIPDTRGNRKTGISTGRLPAENRVSRIEMFTLSVETHFWASHQLTLPNGSKEPLHGHNWSVTADVSSDKLNGMGLVMDFGRFRTLVEEIVAGFDNIGIDRVGYFQQNGSSAEAVAKYIYEKLEPKLPRAVKLEDVVVAEEPGCSAKFSKPR